MLGFWLLVVIVFGFGGFLWLLVVCLCCLLQIGIVEFRVWLVCVVMLV